MTTAQTATIRVYLPHTFIDDAREGDPDLWPLWERVESLPTTRRGGGTGVWADLTALEAAAIRKEAEYRAEYWLTDAYGVEDVQPHERTAGRAARRVAEALSLVSDRHPTVDLPAHLEGPRLPTTYVAEDVEHYSTLRDSIPTDVDHEPIDS